MRERMRVRESRAYAVLVGGFVALAILTVGQMVNDRLENQQIREELADVARLSSAQTEVMIEQALRDGKTPAINPEDVPDVDDVLAGEEAPDPKEVLPPDYEDLKGDKGDQGDQGDQGEPGPGPTAAQIRAAVERFCASSRCKGRAPTPAEVRKQ
jgi:hypothetical protein